jgi:probable HAF family extracellular repeat protein
MKRWARWVWVLALWLVLTVEVQAIQYYITDLGSFAGGNSYAYSINNKSQVVGDSSVWGDYNFHAFLYSDGSMQDLGTLSGGNLSSGRSINDNGEIVGWSRTIPDGGGEHAFLYSGGIMRDLGTLGGTFSYARSINNNSQIVGNSDITGPSNWSHAFLYSNNIMQDLGTLGGNMSCANAINNRGQVVGHSDASPGTHAFLYSDDVMQDLGTLGGSSSLAEAINDSGQVVGSSDITGNRTSHAFLYSGGVMQDLGTLGVSWSVACDINNNGQVVGNYFAGPDVHAFLYSNGAMADLNVFLPSGIGWMLKEAWSINESGEIVGWGYNPEGAYHAYLLTPVPDPCTLALLALGGLAIARRRR